jgi:hypothetical protein
MPLPHSFSLQLRRSDPATFLALGRTELRGVLSSSPFQASAVPYPRRRSVACRCPAAAGAVRATSLRKRAAGPGQARTLASPLGRHA